MATAASALLVLSLWLAAVFGTQMRPWSWGPALLALCASLVCAAIASRHQKNPLLGPGTLLLGLATATWFAWRAFHSPVPEAALADLLLLGAAVGCFLVTRLIHQNSRAEAVFLWGLATLLLASITMIAFQLVDTDFSQYRSRPANTPTAFFVGYNEGTNFTLGLALLLAGAAPFARCHTLIKIAALLLASVGLASMALTLSRSSLLAAAAGLFAWVSAIVIIGAKRRSSWFKPAVIALPIAALAIGILLFVGWSNTQDRRSKGNGDLTQMMDNVSRLRDYSLAYETILLHPLTGGGSRSYSWECMQVWNPEEHGLASHLPGQTHNEILQAATDYGLIGAALLIALFGWITIRALWHFKFDEEKPTPGHTPRDAIRLGGLAALTGILAQSNFSFVFHLLPSTMLLGIALGRLATPSANPTPSKQKKSFIPNTIVAALATITTLALLAPSIAATRILTHLAPVFLKIGPTPTPDERIAAFSRAIAIRPDSELHETRAILHQSRAVSNNEILDPGALQLAIQDYQSAASLHPKFPGHILNAANLLSLAGQDAQAESAYHQAIRLQGNMEPAFRANFNLAEHHRRVGIRHHQQGDYPAALSSMQAASDSFNQGKAISAWIGGDTIRAGHNIQLSLALAQEAAGDPAAALKTCDDAIQLKAHTLRYHAGMIQYRRALTVWHQRKPEAAVPIFQDARNRLLGSRRHLPQGVSSAELEQHIADIDAHLRLLRNAGYR